MMDARNHAANSILTSYVTHDPNLCYRELEREICIREEILFFLVFQICIEEVFEISVFRYLPLIENQLKDQLPIYFLFKIHLSFRWGMGNIRSECLKTHTI